MLQSVYISNFRAWDDITITLDGKHAFFVGENSSGKTTILQALEYFFNQKRIPASFVRNPDQPVVIGVRHQGSFYKRVFSGQTHQLTTTEIDGDGEGLDDLHYAYLPSGSKAPAILLGLNREALTEHIYENLILGIDDLENSFDGLDLAPLIGDLQTHVGQVLATTRSNKVLKYKQRAQLVPVGESPGRDTAELLKGTEPVGRTYLLVEGKYDLPWFKHGLQECGATQRFYVLPAGGSNLDELAKALRGAGLPCMAIVDGDTLPSPKHRKYALARDCIELYAPKSLLNELYGLTPPITSKDDFFYAIQRAHPNTSRDNIKDAIAERIGGYLNPESAFVRELHEIISKG